MLKSLVWNRSGWQNVWVAKSLVWQKVRAAKCLAKCLGGIMSVWQNVGMPKCLSGKMSWWQNVGVAKCLLPKCCLPKCLLPKCWCIFEVHGHETAVTKHPAIYVLNESRLPSRRQRGLLFQTVGTSEVKGAATVGTWRSNSSHLWRTAVSGTCQSWWLTWKSLKVSSLQSAELGQNPC